MKCNCSLLELFLFVISFVFGIHITDKLQSQKPRIHLKVGGDYQNTESTENFVHPYIKQTQEMAKDNNEEDRWMRSQEEERRKDEEMKILVSKLEDLNGRSLEIPEYRDAYKVLVGYLFLKINKFIKTYIYIYIIKIRNIKNVERVTWRVT